MSFERPVWPVGTDVLDSYIEPASKGNLPTAFVPAKTGQRVGGCAATSWQQQPTPTHGITGQPAPCKNTRGSADAEPLAVRRCFLREC